MIAMAEPRWRSDRNCWSFSYQDIDGKRRFRSAPTKGEAVMMQHAIERELQPVKLGIVTAQDYSLNESGKRPLPDVLADFKRHLVARSGDQHVKKTLSNIKAIAAWCGFKTLADIEPVGVEGYLNNLTAQGSSPNNRNRYRASMIELMRWAEKRAMVRRNTLVVIEKLNERLDRRNVSRSLSVEQFWDVIDVTRDQLRGGPQRSLYYWLAGRAGLRWSEIQRLEWRHVDLGDDPALLLTADITKNGRDSILALDEDLTEALRGADLGDPLFPRKPTALTWKRDLHRAGIIGPKPEWAGYKNAEGALHRKCLRATYGTNMAMAGVPLMDCAKRMRHTDPKLTMEHYVKLTLNDQRRSADLVRRPVAPGLRPGAKSADKASPSVTRSSKGALA